MARCFGDHEPAQLTAGCGLGVLKERGCGPGAAGRELQADAAGGLCALPPVPGSCPFSTTRAFSARPSASRVPHAQGLPGAVGAGGTRHPPQRGAAPF